MGLVPVIIFWFFEEKFGTFWGLVCAMVWGIGEASYEYITTKKVQKLTLISTGLVVVLGGVSLLLDKSVYFKFSPVVIEVVFAGFMVWQLKKGNPMFIEMAQKMRPNIVMGDVQKQVFNRLTKALIFLLLVHCVLLSYYALNGTTSQWAFWKGIGFYVLFLVWFFVEYAYQKVRRPRR